MKSPAINQESLVAALRRQVERLEKPQPLADDRLLSTGSPALDGLLPGGGVRRGSLVEYLSPGAGSGTGTLALCAAREACAGGRALVVVDRRRTFYPPAAIAWGIDLASLLILQPADNAAELWAIDQALRCSGVGAVYAPCGSLDVRDFRRLQLAAEAGGTLGILLRPARLRGQPTWADVQWQIRSKAQSPKSKVVMSRPWTSPPWQFRVELAQPCRRAGGKSGGPGTGRNDWPLGTSESLPCAASFAFVCTPRVGWDQRAMRAQGPPEQLARLAEHCERFSPIVGWGTVEGWEGPKSKVQGPKLGSDFGPWTLDLGLLLDVTGIGVLFGGEEALARAVITDLAELGYEVRVGIAGTIGAAWAAAQLRIGEASGQVLSTQYLVLSTLSTPCLADNQSSTAANSQFAICNLQFAISSLRLPPELLALLAQLGIERLDQLLALPRASLRARFGERLLLRIDQFTGAAQETIVAYRPPPKFTAEKVLEYPAEQRELIEHIAQDLIHQIAAALAERREGVVQLACRLDCAPGQPVTIEISLFRPSADPQHLWELVRMQLEQLRLPGAVGRITLQAKLTAPLENRQAQLFTGNQDEASRQFGLLIDRLSSRLGPEAVLRPQLIADPLPERAVGWEAAVVKQGAGVRGQGSVVRRRTRNAERGTRKDGQVLSTKYSVLSTKNRYRPPTLDSRPPTHRPLTLVAPHVLQATAIFPDGPPLAFDFQSRRHEVAHYSGPERIETGWWRGANVRRDYYRVQTEDGLRFWLFRDLKTSQWHLHGEFS